MLAKILLFLVGAIADFFAFMFLLRFLMQAFRVSFANPIGQTVVALTSWAVLPLRRLLPGLAGFDLASLVPAWLTQVALFAFTLLLTRAGLLGEAAMLFAALAIGAIDVVRITIYVLIVALIGAAIISWVNPYTPMAQPIMQLSRPVLRPIQRFVPPLANIDLSPLIAILLLQVVLMVLDGLKGGVIPALLR
jgi:YggT family protein